MDLLYEWTRKEKDIGKKFLFLRVNGGAPRDQNDRSTKFDLVFYCKTRNPNFKIQLTKLFPFISRLLSCYYFMPLTVARKPTRMSTHTTTLWTFRTRTAGRLGTAE